jgi:cytochrome c6
MEERMKAVISMGAVALAMALAIPAMAEDDAATLYKQKCATCHAADGTGSAVGKKMGAKDFKDPDVVKQSDTELTKTTKEGKGKMPKYEGKLTDAQIKDLVAYIRTLQKK